MSPSPQTLERFVVAQERNYTEALAELTAGKKQTHWIWYVLPQLKELGHSQMAKDYGIADRTEAEAYLAHPLLGPRLLACVHAILKHAHQSPGEILGNGDAVKFRSCLTLFAYVAPSEQLFQIALEKFYQGKSDPHTVRILGAVDR